MVVFLGLVTGIAVSLTSEGAAVGAVPPWVIPLVFLGAELHGLADRRGTSVGAISAGSAAMALALLEGPGADRRPLARRGRAPRHARSSAISARRPFLRRLGSASISASAAVAVFGLLGRGTGDRRAGRRRSPRPSWRGAASGLVRAATVGIGGRHLRRALLEVGPRPLLRPRGRRARDRRLAPAAGRRLRAGRRSSCSRFVATALALRAREQEVRRLAQLSGLEESLQMAQRAHGLESDISQLLASTSRLVDADTAWIVVLSREKDMRLLAERSPTRGGAPATRHPLRLRRGRDPRGGLRRRPGRGLARHLPPRHPRRPSPTAASTTR